MTSLSPHGTYPTCVADAFFPTHSKFKTDSMFLWSAPLAALCVTGISPQKLSVISAAFGSRLRAMLAFPRRTPFLFSCDVRCCPMVGDRTSWSACGPTAGCRKISA